MTISDQTSAFLSKDVFTKSLASWQRPVILLYLCQKGPKIGHIWFRAFYARFLPFGIDLQNISLIKNKKKDLIAHISLLILDISKPINHKKNSITEDKKIEIEFKLKVVPVKQYIAFDAIVLTGSPNLHRISW